MGTLQTNPETLPDTVTNSWQPLIQRDALGYAGMNKITLTNWDGTTTIPQLAQGSIIDIDGSLAVFAVNEAITDVAADGTVYLKFVVSGSAVTPEFTAEVPTWYADKAGWYNAAGERFSGHNCSKAGTAYTNKSRFMDEKTGDSRQLLSDGATYMESAYVELITSDTTISKLTISPTGMTGTYGFLVVNGSIVIPAGCYMIASADDSSGSDKVYLQVYTGSAWEGDVSADLNDYWWPGGLVMSDGANYRFVSSGGAVTLHYRKIW